MIPRTQLYDVKSNNILSHQSKTCVRENELRFFAIVVFLKIWLGWSRSDCSRLPRGCGAAVLIVLHPLPPFDRYRKWSFVGFEAVVAVASSPWLGLPGAAIGCDCQSHCHRKKHSNSENYSNASAQAITTDEAYRICQLTPSQRLLLTTGTFLS